MFFLLYVDFYWHDKKSWMKNFYMKYSHMVLIFFFLGGAPNFGVGTKMPTPSCPPQKTCQPQNVHPKKYLIFQGVKWRKILRLEILSIFWDGSLNT